MSIGISEEHVELASSLRKWAADLQGRGLARAAEEDDGATFASAWAALTEMGVPTIGLPESAGGGGGTTLDVAVALEAGHIGMCVSARAQRAVGEAIDGWLRERSPGA